MFPPAMIQFMRDELTQLGVEDLRTPADVDRFMSASSGTALVVVNSVCGCAGGAARPAVALALQNRARPDRSGTVFAGQDLEATAHFREVYLADLPPSSPSVALFKDGELVHFVPRHMIERRTPEMIADELAGAFKQFCPVPA